MIAGMLFCILFNVIAKNGLELSNIENCKTCVYGNIENESTIIGSPTVKIGIIAFLIMIVTIYSWFSYHKKRFVFIGFMAFFMVVGSYTFAIVKHNNKPHLSQPCDFGVFAKDTSPVNHESVGSDSLILKSREMFKPVGDEFVDANYANISTNTDSSLIKSEFLNESIVTSQVPVKKSNKQLIEVFTLLLITIFIGVLIKYTFIRNYRNIILLSSLVYLGFIKGGCPCMIMSFENTILFLLGLPVSFVVFFLFMGLVVVTYFFGKIWCGWICHLGALQEFLFRTHKIKWISSKKVNTFLKFIQVTTIVILVIQLILTHNNICIKYDPFRSIFNLISTNIISHLSIALLLSASVFIYRPFCRGICPVGLILGLITNLPGARKIANSKNCNNCNSCVRSCKLNTITSNDSKIIISTENCILCGECIETCKRSSLSLKGIVE
jgi:NAD-dependent dihydropyrimidine dehydrogenase PreA subunit